MLYVFDQNGRYGLALKDRAGLKVEVLRSRNADTDKTYYAVSITKNTWDAEVPTELPGTEFYGGVYEDKETATDEVLRLGRLLKKFENGEALMGNFQFEKSEVYATDLIRMTTPFI